MSQLYLLLAILFEVLGTTCMKLSMGFTKPTPSVLLFVFYLLCITFLTLALKQIEIAVAYAIWSGLGTALLAVIGMGYFKEPITWVKVASILLIILGVMGLNLQRGAH